MCAGGGLHPCPLFFNKLCKGIKNIQDIWENVWLVLWNDLLLTYQITNQTHTMKVSNSLKTYTITAVKNVLWLPGHPYVYVHFDVLACSIKEALVLAGRQCAQSGLVFLRAVLK